MKRRNFVKNIALAIGALPLLKLTPSSAAIIPPGGSIPLRLNLSTPGRVGFYVDYSELDTIGTHIFYVCRTHGTEGTVSVGYKTFGDNHSNTAGTLTWGNGEADVKSFTVNVNSKGPGDHRIFAQLTNPTGGVALHHGDHTIAHGVIDDDSIQEANAIFMDASSNTAGDGTRDNPYNDWITVRNNLSQSTRYVYIKGFFNTSNSIDAPTGVGDGWHAELRNVGHRTSENERLYIRSWPGFDGGIDGNGSTNMCGFKMEDGGSYVTFRKLTFKNLANSAPGSNKCYFLRTDSRSVFNHDHITCESLEVDGVVAGQVAATAGWYSEGYCLGYKMWRCNLQNLSQSDLSQMWGFESYSAAAVSIQRCTFGKMCEGVYEKQPPSISGQVGFTIRFNYFDTGFTRFSSQGALPMTNWGIVQSNIFHNPIEPPMRHFRTSPASDSQKRWIVGNVIHNWQHGTLGAVWMNAPEFRNTTAFNNIFHKVRVAYRYDDDQLTAPEFSNFNHFYNGSSGLIYRFDSGEYNALDSLRSAKKYELSSEESEPLFENAQLGDFRLSSQSPCKNSGISGTDKGVYLTGVEIIGANGLAPIGTPKLILNPPSKITQFNVSVE